MMESHYSFNSSEGTGVLFSAMFSDSAIAKTFACGATSPCTLAPHFKQLLCKKLSSDREDWNVGILECFIMYLICIMF
ncbi:hypothetical protein PHYPO_G00072410 [Pangasianodon hypophthalmus]|uniref:Uncharacterized protein n=1 Tax=Pangasianodon hypophthalmus TaxID=310915 RepID=A0A5N5LW62_PANHP|nr:hypothetical protein PHYPO_G00072410 [Pangasianodon hypophthalmus]